MWFLHVTTCHMQKSRNPELFVRRCWWCGRKKRFCFPISRFIINFNFSTKAFLFHLDPLLVKCADSSVWNDTEVILKLAGIKSCDFCMWQHVTCKKARNPELNGRNIVGRYMLRPFAHAVVCCWMLLHVAAQSLKPVKLLSQQLPTFLLFRNRRSVAQQCWIRLHSSSNIVGAMHAHYTWFTKTYGLYTSHNAL